MPIRQAGLQCTLPTGTLSPDDSNPGDCTDFGMWGLTSHWCSVLAQLGSPDLLIQHF
jgi:hypothetical protein